MISTSAMLPTVMNLRKPTFPAGVALQSMSSHAPSAALRGERDAASGMRYPGDEGSVDFRFGVDDTHAIRPDETDIPLPAKSGELFLVCRPSAVPTSAKPAAEQTSPLMSPLVTILERKSSTIEGTVEAGDAITTSSTSPTQSLHSEDAIYHWSDSSLLSVLQGRANEQILTAELDRIAMQNRETSVKIGGRATMLRIPITFDITPIERLKSADDLCKITLLTNGGRAR